MPVVKVQNIIRQWRIVPPQTTDNVDDGFAQKAIIPILTAMLLQASAKARA